MATIHRPLPLWADDWLTSQAVSGMSLDQQGAYIRLLCFCWLDRDCGVLKHCFRLLSGISVYNDQDAARKLDDLEQQFVQHPSVDDKITHPKLYQLHLDDLEYREKKRAAGSAGGQAKGKQRPSKGQAEPKPPSPSPSPEEDTPARDPRTTAPEQSTKRQRWVPTTEQEERCKALSRGLLRHRGIRRDIMPNAKVCGYLDCAADNGRSQAEACALLEAYPALDDPKLREAGWPPALFPHRLTALLARGAADSSADSEAIDRVLVAIGQKEIAR